MKTFLLALLAIFIGTSFSRSDEFCITPAEKKMYDLLMEYRKEKGLPAIPLSYSLTQVAKMHADDLQTNNPTNSRCNLHSWSKKGKWKSCCYTNNHSQAECMWNKPRELTEYTGNGYEIAARVVDENVAEAAINGWKKSSGHNQVMINKSTWKNMEWQAVGVGIAGEYAVIWFGAETDPSAQIIAICN